MRRLSILEYLSSIGVLQNCLIIPGRPCILLEVLSREWVLRKISRQTILHKEPGLLSMKALDLAPGSLLH